MSGVGMRRWRQGQALAAVLALLLAVGAVRPAQAFDQGLLWQVMAQGKVRGYVFGTIHLGDPRVAGIRPGVADALIASDAVVTELAMEPENLRRAAAGLLLPEGERLQEAFNQAFLYRRNAIMAERMDQRFRQGKTFVAVGALHLAGERGVLRLLERRGYSVTRMPL